MKTAIDCFSRRWVEATGMACALLILPFAARSENLAARGRPSATAQLTEFSQGRMVIQSSALRADRIQFELPGAAILTAVLDRREQHGSTGFAWVGHLEGEPLSRVCLGSCGNAVAGLVDRSAYQPADSWRLLPDSSGGHAFRRSVGMGADFTCGAPPIPAAERRQARVSGLSVTHDPAADAYAAAGTVPTVMDLLVVYSPAARTRYTLNGLNALILQAVADANTTLGNSYAGVLVHLVAAQEVAHVESPTVSINLVLGRLVVPGDGFLDTVPILRNQYGADLVTFISEDSGASGVAYIPYLSGVYHPEYAYNVINDASLVGGALTHELGHNLGCNHDREHTVSSDQSITPYGFGYQSCGDDALGFRDIMAYECNSGGTSQRLSYFSNPWLSYLGRPLGVDYAIDPSHACDNARTIRETAGTVSAFRPSVRLIPSAIGGLSATASSFNQVSLTWAAPDSGTAGVEVLRSTDGGSTWKSVASLIGGVTTWMDHALSPSTTYSYQVRSFNSAGAGARSASVSATTPGTRIVPAAPTNLSIQPISKSRLDLAWTDVATNEDGYRVERSTDGGPYLVQSELGWNSIGYNDGVGLMPGHTYAYRVTAFNAAGSSPASVATYQISGLPGAPTSLSYVPLTTASAQLNWLDTSNNETGFIVESSTDGTHFQTIASRSANQTSFTVTGLVPGTSYSYRVWAQNLTGLSPAAACNSFLWGQLPTPPGILAVKTISPGQIALTWTDTSLNESSFTLERAGTDSIFSSLASIPANVTSFTDTTVLPVSTYAYRLRSANPFGSSSYTPALYVTSANVPVTLPSAPTGLTASAIGQNQITLGWMDTSADETGFVLERTSGTGIFVTVGTPSANSVTFKDTTVTPGTSYTYRIRSVNTGGVSAPSSVLTVTSLPLAPVAPLNLTATATTPNQVAVGWADASANETGFAIERSPGNGSFSQIGTAAINAIQFTDSTAVAGTTYSYRVRAYNAGGYSSYSSLVTLTTPAVAPTAPTSLNASLKGSLQIYLSWKDRSSNETGFRIERATGTGAFVVLTTTLPNSTAFTDTNVAVATTYTYRVLAMAGTMASVPSSSVTVSTAATTVASIPLAPSALVAGIAGTGGVALSWLDNANNETSYSVERALGNGGYSVIATLGANSSSYLDAAVSAGTTYSYRVRAANATGNSAYAAAITITTAASVTQSIPAAPTSLTATAVTANQVSLGWTDTSNNETGFKVEFLSGSTWIQLTNLSANVNSCVIAGLSGKTSYSFRISSFNAAGSSTPVTITLTTL